MAGIIAATWGVAGVVLILASAIYRLTPLALDTFSHSLSWTHWLALTAVVVFMAYTEGYRGFQQGFSPRVAARARYLRDQPSLIIGLLAPLFCMALVCATPRRLAYSWLLVAAIVGFVLLIQLLAQPWRGMVDLGVVVGLTWGSVSILAFTWRAFYTSAFDFPTDIPGAA